MSKFYEEPKNKFPRATGQPTVTFNLKHYNKENLTKIQRKAVEVAYIRHSRYCEENGYEHELWYLYERDTETLYTNDIQCPNVCHHHIGSTCGVCGQVD
jgi:hypothetical protein